MNKIVGGIVAGIVGVFLMIVAFGSWFTVDQGERGVVLRNGAFVRVADPGLGFKTPWIEEVVDMSVRTQKALWDGKSALSSYSKDIQAASLSVAVNYHVDPGMVRHVYEVYGTGYEERVIWPAVSGNTKIVFGQFNAKEAIEKRGKLSVDIEESIRAALDGTGIIIDSVQVQNVDFSDDFEKSIEARMQAEVEVSRLQQNLEREKVQADILRTQATAKADAVRAAAKAQADATKMQGDAEASAIIARSEALKQNANLIELVKAEKWDGKLPVTMLPGSAVPFIGVR